MTEIGWAVYEMVLQNGVSDLEKVETEEPFFLRENCQKRVDELNRVHPAGVQPLRPPTE